VVVSFRSTPFQWLTQGDQAMTRSFPSFLKNFSNRTIAMMLGLLVACAALWTPPAHAQSTVLPGVTVSSPSTLPPSPIYGVTVWGSGGSATAAQSAFQTAGSGAADSGAVASTNEVSSLKTLISFKADAACGPQCGDQVVLFQANNLQEGAAASFAKILGGQQGAARAESGTAFQNYQTAGGKFSPLTTGPVPAPTSTPTTP